MFGIDTKVIINYVVAAVIMMLLTKYVLSKISFFNYDDGSYEE